MDGNERALVGVIMGSDNDIGVMRQAVSTLKEFKVPYEVLICSAHRSPDRASLYAASAHERGLRVIICGAGMAAHLAGAIAALTILPVIAVPLSSSPLAGLDALLSSVQMPPGVPVATTAINGARNAAVLAVQILALWDPDLTESLKAFKGKMAEDIDEKNKNLTALLEGPAKK
ncbi:MAG: 5-(carboxyamino)imidazole ribonucleotide mutase [Deltaproteobacteria bacterium]|jgi:phosphoribosylaminoimidazole carboxylase PurE protein|nr:5-(carboxyamino)imidazole ribonucleotide mutase [Deltaproteobacteria bacterium]